MHMHCFYKNVIYKAAESMYIYTHTLLKRKYTNASKFKVTINHAKFLYRIPQRWESGRIFKTAETDLNQL